MKWHVQFHSYARQRTASVWSDELEDWDMTELDARRIRSLSLNQTYEDSHRRVWTRV